MLDERDIKAAVIDRLFNTGALKNAVLINEMVYANWSRRADLAVANGHLHAFEIKSDLDSLRRLQGQIGIYLQRFDKLTLVVSPKFVDTIIATTPTRVAVWSACWEDKGIKIKVVRSGKQEKIEDRDVLIDYFLRDELYLFLSSRGVTVRRSAPRSELVKLAKEQPVSKLREYLLHSLKLRYQESFASFSNLRTNQTSPDNLKALRKTKDVAQDVPPRASHRDEDAPQIVELNLARLFPAGVIPTEIPTSIFVRNKVVRRRRPAS